VNYRDIVIACRQATDRLVPLRTSTCCSVRASCLDAETTTTTTTMPSYNAVCGGGASCLTLNGPSSLAPTPLQGAFIPLSLSCDFNWLIFCYISVLPFCNAMLLFIESIRNDWKNLRQGSHIWILKYTLVASCFAVSLNYSLTQWNWNTAWILRCEMSVGSLVACDC